MDDSRATAFDAYELVADVLFGRVVGARRCARAYRLPVLMWKRMLALEGCAERFHHALHRRGDLPLAPESLRRLLATAFTTAVERALQIHHQLAEIAAIAQTSGIRVMALKGAARVLLGEMAGARSMADIDLLVREADAPALHRLLRTRLGYAEAPAENAVPHHLSGLTRRSSLGVEIHTRLSDRPVALDDEIWADAGRATVGGASIAVPSSTNMVLHALEHAISLNWDLRYRLRDILDVASLWGPDVDIQRVRAHVADSGHRRAMERLLSAASAAHSGVPHYPRAHAAGIVRRIARARLAAAMRARNGATAIRLYRYVGVLAEASLREMRRASWQIVRRGAHIPFGAMALLLVAGCESSTAPDDAAAPVVVFASHVDGVSAIFRTRNDSTVRLSAPDDEDSEPRCTGERIVFTSRRSGDSEVYIANLDLGAQRRLTTNLGFDGEAALDPTGSTIAFVSDRSGSPRLWLIEADGSNPRALSTGSEQFVPERAPVWNPAGTQLAFTSTRTNTSQVFLIPRSGGDAIQLTHESTGAFDPAWSPDGGIVLYTALAGPPEIMMVPAGGGAASVFASSPLGLGEAACGTLSCIAVVDPLGTATALARIAKAVTGIHVLAGGSGDHHHPSILPR